MRSLLSIAIAAVLVQPLSAETLQCEVASTCPSCAGPLFEAVATLQEPFDPATTPVQAEADRYRIVGENQYTMEGAAVVQRGNQWLWSERLEYDAERQRMESPGPLRLQSETLLMRAASGSWRETGSSRLRDMQFQLRDGRGGGRAEKARVQPDGDARLTRASFTSCDPESPSWQLTAGRIDLDHESGIGRARQVKLKLGKVPVLYLPYARFPIDDRRQSGFLLPSLGNSNDAGYDLIVPYYLNLAPNYDATLSPRLIRDRGLMLGAEVRHLGERSRTEFDLAWLGDDDRTGRHRSAFDLVHQSRFNANWGLDASLRDVSDARYFEDFGESLASVATSLLPSHAYLRGRGAFWDFSFGGDRQQVTDPRLSLSAEPYRRLPRATFDLVTPNLRGPQLEFDSEWVRFRKDDTLGGDRLDLHPRLVWPLEYGSGFFRPSLAYRYTQYQLQGEGTNSPSRGVPIASLDAGLVFERSVSWFGKAYTQSLEPRAYALYVPYEDQSTLPLFDTQAYTFGFASLFRDNRFSGADRQSDARQITVAVSSGLIDDKGRERARFSFGGIHYFESPRVVLPGEPVATLDGSDLVGEFEWSISEQFSFGVGTQWDPHSHRNELAYASFTHRFSDRGQWRASYRYRRDQLEQADIAALIPLNEHWRLITRWNRSFSDAQLLEAFAGVEYDSCCYAVRVLGRRYVRNFEGELNNGIMLELELKGLGSLGRRTEDFLSRAMLGLR